MKEHPKVCTRVICFNAQASNVQRILRTLPNARPSAARTPRPADYKRLSSYGKFLALECNARHTHAHFHYPGAFGILLANMNVWKECVKWSCPFLIFEENAHLGNVDELHACIRVFHAKKLDVCMLHQYGLHQDNCDSSPPPQAIASTAHGTVMRMHTPAISAKAYLLSPRFAAHMLRLTQSRIDNVHVDWALYGEAMYPSGRAVPFRGAYYAPRGLVNVMISTGSKHYPGIQHEPPRRNGQSTILRDIWRFLSG